ncbi:MAG: peptidoglycan DD-metalloendopeptidase family protein [Bacteroidales bacterium]|nr:peptidoglycan DD-metalloendopeptidase family protein [Bacteroidales bacterium]
MLTVVKKILPMLLVLALAAPAASGQSKKQLERDKARIEKEIERLTSELGKARKDTRNRTRQIKLINQRIDERNKLINNINSQMTHLDRQITRTEDSLRVVRGQIDSMKAEYALIVRTLYGLRGNVNSATLLFDNTTYNLSYLKMKYFKEYSRYRKHQAAAIKRREQLFTNIDLDLQRQRNEKSTLLAQERKQRQALTREQQQHQRSLDKSQQSERSLQQQINKKEQQKRQLQQQIQQLINAEVAKSSTSSNTSKTGKTGKTSTSTPSDALSSDFAQNKGRMPWPVHYKSVAREYGLYTRASGGQNRNLGIDLNCAPGANVRSVAAGVVARIFEAPDGSSGIIIKHGLYLTVYAGLGTVSVRAGAKVTAGQSLGTVYQSDEPTSQFSFQLWCGKDPLNPRHWLN